MDDVIRARLNGHAAQCEGKIAFKRQRIALEAAERRGRHHRVVYRCRYCFHWHVGTPDPKPKKFEKRKKLIQLFLQTEWVNE